VTLWAAIWLRENVEAIGGLGIAMVVAGAMILAIPVDSRRGRLAGISSVAWATATALFSSFYSVLDRAVMLELPPGLARIVYLHLSFTAMWLGLSLLAARRRPWHSPVTPKALLVASTIAVLALGTYLLVLWVFSIPAAPVGYTVALRQFSAMIGVLMGWRVLREPRGWIRLVSAAVMVAGLILLTGPWHR
jgi:drug/metabolite transporter (DMT)-like permease